MAASEKIKQKRKVLAHLSQQAKEIREGLVKQAIESGNNNAALNAASRTLNSIIIEFFYKKSGHDDFRTFKEWSRDGKRVKKGEKGFIIWGRPLGVIKQEREEPTSEEDNKFFPVSHLFSNMQIE
jgi:hypothetical protein